MRRQFFLSTLLIVMIPAIAYGQSISAVWDPNPPEDQITGYQVCIGTTPLSCNVQQANVAGWETAYTFAPTPGVLYRFAVRALNASGAGSYTPEVAASVPSLAQLANQTGSANVPISPLSLSATDPDGSPLQFSHSGLPFGLSLNSSTGIITGTPTSAGTFGVTVFVSDDLGTSSRTFTWTVQPAGGNDVAPPALAITSHSSGQTVSTSSITLAGTASDSGSGGSGVTGVTVNGAAATGGSATGSNSASWSRSVTLATGANTFTVVATDGAGNARSATITINRSSPDTTAPTLSITSHSSGQTVSTATITLAGTASDSGSGGNGITSVTVNGAAATGGSASGSNTANWSRGITLATGANTVTVVATDGAGIARSATITINRPSPDTTAPTLSISSHSAGQTVSTATITLAGTASDNGAGGSGITSVTVNGSAASGGSASGNNAANWSRSITLASGANVVTVVATDGAGNARTTPITLVGPTSNVALSVSITPNLSSPRTSGTPVTFTAAGAGGTAPHSFKWWVQKDGGAWVMVQDWSAGGWTWTPSQPGSYVIGVWGRSAGNSADVAQAIGTTPFVIATQAQSPAAPPPSSGGSMTAASVNANLSSPRTAGTTVTFTASGVGGNAPYSFKWWLQKDGGAWVMVQDWSTSATWTWTPGATGTYSIGVWSRSAGISGDTYQAIGTTPFVISATQAPAPPPPSSGGSMSSASVSASLASPRQVWTAVTFTASGTGGSGPYSFKWWVQKNGGAWVLRQEWSTSTTFSWTPSEPGNYVIGVWGRSAGNGADTPQAIGTMPYLVSAMQPGPPMTGSSLTSSASATRASASITLAASGVGGAAPYTFKWWVQRNGGAWVLLQDWSVSPTYQWTPSLPGSYVLGIWGRSASSAADTAQTIATTSVTVVP
jgi:hypothetical protein